MTYRLGLTGSIGMGKSSTLALFAAAGHPVWDADAAVHRLYGAGGAAVAPVATAFPAVVRNRAIDRDLLRPLVAADPRALGRLEAIVHPLVAADRERFIAGARASGARLVVLDIPLLYETGAEAGLDGVAVVSTSAAVQRARVLSRPGMTEATLAGILARQMPDAEKRARADWVISTDTPEAARVAVDRVLADILSPQQVAG